MGVENTNVGGDEGYEAFRQGFLSNSLVTMDDMREHMNCMRLSTVMGSVEPRNFYEYASTDVPGVGDASNALGGWRELGKDVQAGKGKAVGMTLNLGPGERDYDIPLDDIGNKKGRIISNGTTVKFVQTDGTLWNSSYVLTWVTGRDGKPEFHWSRQ